MLANNLDKKIREPDLLSGSLDVFLHLVPVLPERECPVRRRLLARPDGRVVGRAKEVGNGVALRPRVGYHFVLHALVSVIAPCLQIKISNKKAEKTKREPS